MLYTRISEISAGEWRTRFFMKGEIKWQFLISTRYVATWLKISKVAADL
jgi:hypothetical protein